MLFSSSSRQRSLRALMHCVTVSRSSDPSQAGNFSLAQSQTISEIAGFSHSSSSFLRKRLPPRAEPRSIALDVYCAMATTADSLSRSTQKNPDAKKNARSHAQEHLQYAAALSRLPTPTHSLSRCADGWFKEESDQWPGKCSRPFNLLPHG